MDNQRLFKIILITSLHIYKTLIDLCFLLTALQLKSNSISLKKNGDESI